MQNAMLFLLISLLYSYGEGIVVFFYQIKHWRPAWGNARRLVIDPPTSIKDPIEAAKPIHIVCTSGRTNCIVS